MQISGYVTVIVPVHNGALTIRRCLEAIAAQSYRPLEIVVVDDGSTDPTAGWVRAFRRANPELSVHVIDQPRSGLAVALRAGLAKARGEFVAFCHQSDAWSPDKLAGQIGSLQASAKAPYAVAAVAEQRGEVRTIRKAPPFRGALLYEPVSLSSLVIRRARLEAAGGVHDVPDGAVCHDLVSRLALEAPAAVSDRVVATCHRRAGGVTEFEPLVATWDHLCQAGRLSRQKRQWGVGRLYAIHGWKALLADEPERARSNFKAAIEAVPYRPDAWIGLGCAALDRLLFRTGLLRAQEKTS